MIDFTTILPEFLTLVGFRQTANIELSSSLKTSDSGLIINALPDVSMDLIQDASLQIQYESVTSGNLVVGNWYEITDISGSADFTTVGASANTVGLIFEATAGIIVWGTGSLNTSPVIDYLNLVRTEETQNIFKQFVSSLQRKLNITELKVNSKLIKQFATLKKNQNETAKGFYFKLANSKSLEMVIKSISLHLNAVDTCRIYLYEVGKTSAIFQYDYTSKNNEIDFETLTDWKANFEDATNSGKEYLLLYYDYDVDNVQSLIQLEETTEIYYNTESFVSKNNNYVFFTPVEIPKSYWIWNGGTSNYDIPNLENKKALSFKTSQENGLNIDFNIVCNITQILIDNKNLFSKMLQLAFAERILNDAFVSARSNRVKRNSEKESLNFAKKYHALLHGENVATDQGLQWISGEISRVVNNFKNIDCKCFNDNRKPLFSISNAYQTK
ncbi:MAG: hypothetical protein GY849_02345 [Deltaproteobacteria bacterium]|nr:hypothetical protein [Deltaproteobacteria bacterium]